MRQSWPAVRRSLLCYRRIRTSLRGFKNIGESLSNSERCLLVHIHIQGAAHGQAQGPQIVDAVRVVGVRVAQKDAVEPLDLGVDQLLAQVGRGVHENRCRALRPEALDKHRAAAATVLRVGRVASAPPFRDPRHAAG